MTSTPGIRQASYREPSPLLIYDGDCGFCYYWVRYWQKLTGNAVDYKPFQEVAPAYPDIPIEEFQRAVQYVAPDGEVASAAEASFLTLSHAPGKRFWLSLYRRLPGFAGLSELAYRLISRNRGFFYVLSLLLWGKENEPSRYDRIAWLFLRLLGLLYLSAFVSFGSQALGLIGSQGIVPVAELVQAGFAQLGAERYHALPMLFWLNASDLMIQITCWGGALFSILLIFNIIPRISLIVMYVLYLSLTTAGLAFMSFQWDSFLLEGGILALFLFRTRVLGIVLLRWLLFRFIFVAGLVKIVSGEPAWRDFSALTYHFLTQPLPTPLAWYAYYLPQSILSVLTGLALFVELVLPFLIFFPRRLRFLAGIGILMMQAGIVLTGNYNFFNLQTIVLCLVLFDDAAIAHLIPKCLLRFIPDRPEARPCPKVTVFVSYSFALLAVVISLVQLDVRFGSRSLLSVAPIIDRVAPFRLVNIYGPFAVMTKERDEIIIEGSDDSVHWYEYAFKYKPGDVSRPLLWNIPHQPRLDWQMWFAALGSVEDNPWFARFLLRLLENSPPVVALLETNPFPNTPPTYVRAQFYDYRYTTSEERKKTGDTWTRRYLKPYVEEVYLKD